MKKLIALGIAVVTVVAFSGWTYADVLNTSKTIAVSLIVDSNFGFEIWDTEYTANLGNVPAGQGRTADLHMTARSNHVLPWRLSASSTGVVGQTQAIPDTLPVVLSTFDGGAGLTGTVVNNLVLTAVAAPIYTSGVGEAPTAGLLVNGIFSVTSTLSTKQDTYSGTILLTMSE